MSNTHQQKKTKVIGYLKVGHFSNRYLIRNTLNYPPIINIKTRAIMSPRIFKYWLAAFLSFSTAYIVIRGISPFDLDWIIKSIPIFLLMALCQQSLTGNTRKTMLLALGFSVTGDILLSLNGYFIFGLGSFLIAQLIYAGFFFTQFKYSKRGLAWALVIISLLITAGYFILPKSGDLSFVVVLYMVAISSMAIGAGFRQSNQFLLIAMGALIFISSDTLIAINKFVYEFSAAGVLIMTTYYLAQLMITFGVIRHSKQHSDLS